MCACSNLTTVQNTKSPLLLVVEIAVFFSWLKSSHRKEEEGWEHETNLWASACIFIFSYTFATTSSLVSTSKTPSQASTKNSSCGVI